MIDPQGALARVRREAGLPRTADVLPASPTRRIPPSSKASTPRSSARPFDDLVSDRPGTRFAPRSIRSARASPARTSAKAGVDAFADLRVVDYGDAPVVPAQPEIAGTRRSRRTVAEVLAAGALPVILGGDHSITEPCLGGEPSRPSTGGAVGLLHFDTHTDTGEEVFGGDALARHADAPRGRGSATSTRAATCRIGLRGYWPGEKEFGWQAEQGITSLFAHDVMHRGIGAVVEEALATIGGGTGRSTSPSTSTARPGLRPRHRHAQPGGLSLRRAAVGVRHASERIRSSAPTSSRCSPTEVGSADITSLVAGSRSCARSSPGSPCGER